MGSRKGDFRFQINQGHPTFRRISGQILRDCQPLTVSRNPQTAFGALLSSGPPLSVSGIPLGDRVTSAQDVDVGTAGKPPTNGRPVATKKELDALVCGWRVGEPYEQLCGFLLAITAGLLQLAPRLISRLDMRVSGDTLEKALHACRADLPQDRTGSSRLLAREAPGLVEVRRQGARDSCRPSSPILVPAPRVDRCRDQSRRGPGKADRRSATGRLIRGSRAL